MVIGRRRLLHLLAGAAAVPALPRAAFALDYPTRPVHIITGYAAGAGPDIMGRLAAQWLSQRLDQQFIVDNRTGAASNIGTAIAAKSAPDGYTLYVAVSTNAVNQTLYQNLSFNFARDFVPAAFIGATPFVLVTTTQFPAKTMPDFLAHAKQNPGQVDYATSGVGTGPHVAAELLKMMTGIEIVHVPYRGNYVTDVVAGTVPAAVSPMPQVVEFIKSGRLHAVAVTTGKRWPDLPDVPAIGEFVPGYEASGWYSLVAPTGTPAEVIARLNTEMNAGLDDPTLHARILALGVEPRPMSPPAFGEFIAAEIDKWAKVIRFAQLKPAG
ncbi:MAG TPA: tripartite tricarboxylate transporter substrate binding protein [Xanthobacteraceae bacterium]|nr:tripartite tricarboxylate transporter substrate binding protein [Xanthobacteraceae bacterium]